MSDFLNVQQLACERDDRWLFQQLSFQVNPGEIWQVEGPNGSGKTTLLRILAGLLMPQTGEVLWQGTPIQMLRASFQQSLLYTGHQVGVKAHLTPIENLSWYLGMYGDVSSQAVMEALAQVGLTGYEDVLCHHLSAGQLRRVALARLQLATQPLWILDEPFTAIDKTGVAELEQLLLEKAKAGKAIILTTHHQLNLDYHQLHHLSLLDYQAH
ncbi:cytochrome c biogenesis heme-transporting ATPase CcmA [Endozoicomonas sp. SM1973]|uniref:Cytochrome c biogenesis heme-transporting ATPase CcmA n=1 Tax=Spartinivicinus marinus TaxID=2994442 RepID=A0A853I8A2_9GAMM|nr:cytochrome c biogenesis heme-transporting ATPase CcmA [Spartinivicinus marinus]NYZ65465.1 cytochrome c biogenesis heme-transporting ATPase CcmA [Spartinivicinus marinus]